MNQTLPSTETQQPCQTAKEATEDFLSLAITYRIDRPYWDTFSREVSKLSPDLSIKDRLDELLDLAAEHVVKLRDWPIFRKRADRLAAEYGVALKADLM